MGTVDPVKNFSSVDEKAKIAEDGSAGSKKYLIFRTDNLKLGIDTEYVVEILNDHFATYLPMTPDYIRGVFNMRGQIIPVLDIRLLLGKPSIERDALLVVLKYDNTQIGILVDEVDQMTEVPNQNILPMPSQSTQQLLSGMCAIPDGSGTMLILDCKQLLGHE